MLSLKAWMETRWRLLFALALTLLVFLTGQSGGGLWSKANAQGMLSLLSSLSIVAAINLAADGIKTHPAFRATKGLHSSRYFTLSLPVSRLELLITRSGIGLLEFSVITTVVYSLAWILFPLVRSDATVLDLLELIAAGIVCGSCFYFVSVLLSTFLDDAWQIWGSLILFVAAQGLRVRFHLGFLDFANENSPLITHHLPWTSMIASVCLSALFFFATLKIVQAREY